MKCAFKATDDDSGAQHKIKQNKKKKIIKKTEWSENTMLNTIQVVLRTTIYFTFSRSLLFIHINTHSSLCVYIWLVCARCTSLRYIMFGVRLLVECFAHKYFLYFSICFYVYKIFFLQRSSASLPLFLNKPYVLLCFARFIEQVVFVKGMRAFKYSHIDFANNFFLFSSLNWSEKQNHYS